MRSTFQPGDKGQRGIRILVPLRCRAQDCKIGDSENVPKGKCLVWSQAQGRLSDKLSKGVDELADARLIYHQKSSEFSIVFRC